MLITDQRALDFLEILKSHNIVRFDSEFCESIGLRKQNLTKIKNTESNTQSHHFTAEQLQKIGEIYGADMNYIHGFTAVPFRKTSSTKKSTSSHKTDIKTEK